MDKTEDIERGRTFLERLREHRFDDDLSLAYLALDDVIRMMCDPKDITQAATAALGRVLATWAIDEVEGVMRDLGVEDTRVSG